MSSEFESRGRARRVCVKPCRQDTLCGDQLAKTTEIASKICRRGNQEEWVTMTTAMMMPFSAAN